MIKVSDYIAEFLVDKKIDKVFGMIGGAVAHIYDSVDKYKEIEVINTIHEQAAGFAAEGYARVTGKSGVAIATSGPGATNLITAIGSCYFDSVPTLFITGQVNTYEYKYDKPVRQIGFQETDIVSIVKPIVKYAVMVNKASDIRYELEKAYFLSQNGRKGPVLIDVPMDIQRAEVNVSSLKKYQLKKNLTLSENDNINNKIKDVVSLLNNSKRLIVLVGGGVRLSNAEKELLNWLKNYDIPVVYSLMGKDAIKSEYKHNLGLIGAYGNRYGNLAIANSDLLLVLGSRLDTRQTGTDIKTFARKAKIIQVDIDKHEVGFKVDLEIGINSDVKDFINCLSKEKLDLKLDKWLKTLHSYKKKFPTTVGIDNKPKIPNTVIDDISKYLASDEIIAIDVGQHQMWAAQSLITKNNQRVLFSGGMGAMGFALPAAIGASLALNKRIIVIAGDGGIQLNIQELEIIKRRNLPIKIFVLNNNNLGMVRQFQEIYFDKNYQGTVEDYSVPDLVSISRAYGINGRNIIDRKEIHVNLKNIFSNDEPELINIIFEKKMTGVEPKLIVNKPMEDMYPFLEKDTLEELMIIDQYEADSEKDI